MLISDNERFRQEINADQRHSSFSAHFQLVLDRTKPLVRFWRRKWKLPLPTVFNENEPDLRQEKNADKQTVRQENNADKHTLRQETNADKQTVRQEKTADKQT